MGKFINTVRKDTINTLIDGFKERMKNPYYLHSDKKPTIVTYFNKDNARSTLDDGLKIAYEEVGEDSPFKYNKIEDFYIYGLDQIQLKLEVSEFGLAADTVTGDGIILPNTIVPCPGDYFQITYLDNKYLFEVIEVDTDTLENGSNFYKIQYEYSKKDDSEILNQVADNYKMIIDHVGTQFKTIIKNTEYDFVDILDEVCCKLKEYYKSLYFSDRVETFILSNDFDDYFYDPYLIEFIIRNKLMEDKSQKYIHICQQMTLPKTFAIDYDNSFFRNIETKSINRLTKNRYVVGEYINQPLSILCMRKEEYFAFKHVSESYRSINEKYEVFTKELFDRIINCDVRNDNILIDRLERFKGILTIKESATVDEISTAFRGILKVLRTEDNKTYKGLLNIIEPEIIDNENESSNIQLFNSLVKITGVNIPEITDKTFSGMLTLKKTTNEQIYRGLLTYIEQKELKERTMLFKASIMINNSEIENRKKIDNIIIKYFNNIDLSMEDINSLEEVYYIPDNILFYYIPIVIYIFEEQIKKKLVKK